MRIYTLTLITVASLALIGCGTEASDDPSTTPTGAATGTATGTTSGTTGTSTGTATGTSASNSIIDVAEGAGSFTTLLAAVDAAGLTTTLDEGGPFTVMAPTDDAFANLPAGTVDALLDDIPTLTDILLYHVVDGEVAAADVVNYSLVPTLQGSDFKVTVDGDVFINDARITVTDIEADNGVIHVLDAVITPPGSITDIAVADGRFTTLVTALGAAGLDTTLDGEGSFTVFAPTDDAFAALPEGTVDDLLNDIPALTDVLLYHVLDTKQIASDVVAAPDFTMMNGASASVVVDANGASIDGATIIITDIPASNGVIHVIESVMLP